MISPFTLAGGSLVVALATMLYAKPGQAGGTVSPAGFDTTVQQQGVSVSFSLEPALQPAGTSRDGILYEGDPVSVRFAVEDQNDAPLSGLFPAAWIHASSDEETGSADACLSKTKTFIGGSLFARADLDLNVYYVLTLNDDATISVVDPLFGYGGSKLLNMVPLNGVGFDWVLSNAEDRVFVSIPSSGEIAEINVANWQVKHHASEQLWGRPTTMSVHGDSPYLWALTDRGVAVFDSDPFALKQLIKTKSPPSQMTFSADGSRAFVAAEDSLLVIDTLTLSVKETLALHGGPVAMDYSATANELYIAHKTSGEIWAVDGNHATVNSVIQSEPGVSDLRFSPDGRWGFVVNTQTNRLSIIDSAKAAIVQSSLVEDGPEYIAFSDNLAYIRHANSSDLLMVPLDDKDLGREGRAIPAIDTPGGDHPPGLIRMPSGGEGIVQAPGSNAVLLSNYHDKAIYFYKEGMAAPMGQFSNYGKSPRSVLAIDHSLREKSVTGVYETTAVLPKAGLYEAVYFMDSPRVVSCFAFVVSSREDVTADNPPSAIAVRSEPTDNQFKAGEKAVLHFVVGADNEQLAADMQFEAAIQLTSGLWEHNSTVELNSKNRLALEFEPPLPGFYDVYITSQNSKDYLVREIFSYEVF